MGNLKSKKMKMFKSTQILIMLTVLITIQHSIFSLRKLKSNKSAKNAYSELPSNICRIKFYEDDWAFWRDNILKNCPKINGKCKGSMKLNYDHKDDIKAIYSYNCNCFVVFEPDQKSSDRKRIVKCIECKGEIRYLLW